MRVREFNVSPGDRRSYQTIGSAISAAAGGGPCVIHIAPGRYQESFTLREDLTLHAPLGLGSVQIVAPGDTDVITSSGTLVLSGLDLFSPAGAALVMSSGSVQADQCRLGSGADSADTLSAVARGVSRLTLTACTITGGGVGVERGQLSITQCLINQTRGNAVVAWGSASLHISATVITGAGIHGIRVFKNATGTIENCKIQDSGWASV